MGRRVGSRLVGLLLLLLRHLLRLLLLLLLLLLGLLRLIAGGRCWHSDEALGGRIALCSGCVARVA